MKKLILFIAILLSGCSAHDIALSIDNAKLSWEQQPQALTKLTMVLKG